MKTIVRWFVAFILFCFVFVTGSIVSSALLVAAAILVAPIPKIQEKLNLKSPINVVLPIVLFVAAVAIAPNKQSAEKEEVPEPTPVVTQEPTPEPTEEPDESENIEPISIEDAAALIELIIKENFENYSVEYEDDIITVNLWDDNISIATVLAKSGDQEAKDSWDKLVDSQIELSKSTYELVKEAGRDDIIVVYNILNDANKDRVLLSTSSGIVFYNCLEE